MKKRISIIALLVVLLCLTSCERSEYAIEREAKREAAYNDGYEVGYDEGYYEGYDVALDHFSEILNYDAVHYARTYSEWHPEEAMCIIEAYENDELAFGYMQVSEEEYKDAIESLYRYCQYLYYDMYD